MKCVMCNRPLYVPAAAIASREGPLAYGPKCAKKAGLTKRKERAGRRVFHQVPVVAVDPRQMSLELRP